MSYTHYAHSSEQIIAHTVRQQPGPDYKPKGLWLSVDGPYDWKQWCDAETYSGFGSYAHAVKLRRGAKILRLRGAQALDAFTDQYAGEIYPGQGMGGRDHRYCGIDWEAVARQHQGIIIAPYCWQRRMDLMWYYGWDCASGCIWDADAIASICYDEARSAAKIFAGVEPATNRVETSALTTDN